MQVYSVAKPDLAPFEMPARFRTEIVYFITPSDLPSDEYLIRLDEARQWLADLVVSVVSPLDAEAKAEIELTEYHEAWLEWMVANEIEHVRVVK